MRGSTNFTKVVFICFALIYLAIGVISGLMGWRSPDNEWAAGIGHKVFDLTPYDNFRVAHVAPPLGVGFCCTPLSLFLIAPFSILGEILGWSDNFVGRIYQLPFLLIDIMNVLLIINILKLFRVNLIDKHKILIMAILFFSGFFAYASGYMGHPETLVVLFSLLGIILLKKETFYITGLSFGLAFASKQSAVFVFFPILVFLFFQKKRFLNFVKVAAGIVFSSLAVILPFLIRDFNNAWYEIFVQNQKVIINGPNLWWLLNAFLQKGLGINNLGETLGAIANPVLFLTIASASVFLVIRNKINKLNDQFFALIVFSIILSFLLSKWLSIHHFLLGFIFMIIWDTIRNKNFPAFTVCYFLILVAGYSYNNPLWQFMVLLTNIIALGYIFSLLFAKRAAFRYLKKTYDEKIK